MLRKYLRIASSVDYSTLIFLTEIRGRSERSQFNSLILIEFRDPKDLIEAGDYF
jgi:hypothetical protein